MQDARERIVASLVVLLIGGFFGCTHRMPPMIAEPTYTAEAPPPTPHTVEPEAPAAAPVATAQFEQVLLGESVEGRPIPMHILRNGPKRVLIIGGVHGNEPTSVDVAMELLELLRTEPQLVTHATVAIMPVANPDGYERRSRFNANQIDVNRNFNATNFRPALQAGFRSGTQPESEPESQAIVRAIDMIQPDLLISIHSISRGRECNNYDGPAEHVAQLMTEYNGYPAVATIGYPTPGSLGSYAGIDQQIPMITLELPRDLPGDEAWEQNRDAILAAIRMP